MQERAAESRASSWSRSVRDEVRSRQLEERERVFLAVAKRDPRTFRALLSKIIPAEISAEISGGLTTVVVRNYTGIEWEARARAKAEEQATTCLQFQAKKT